ncbi:hypothetical protein HG530_015707 [Fusarium avenaceum]|nr:hypothetical protein HG530_015707 [Fusarium avenaceum]
MPRRRRQARRVNLACYGAVEATGARHHDDSSGLQLDTAHIAGPVVSDNCLVPVSTLQVLSHFRCRIEWGQVSLEHDLLQRLLALRIVAVVAHIGLDWTQARMVKNHRHIPGRDVTLVNGHVCLGVDPARAAVTSCASVVILDEAHHPSHLDAALEGQLTSRFHLPTCHNTCGHFGGTECPDTQGLHPIRYGIVIRHQARAACPADDDPEERQIV